MRPQTTLAPAGASVAKTTREGGIGDDDWNALSIDLYQLMNAALSERMTFDQNLKDWTALYEMQPTNLSADAPWTDSSNLVIPIIPAQLDAIVAYIYGKVFVPRFIMVSGHNAQAMQLSPLVERYYNAEMAKQRGSSTWYDQFMTWVHLAFRDGYSVMEVLWKKSVRKQKVAVNEPELDPDGVPVIDLETGSPRMHRVVREVTVTAYDDVELVPVLARDFCVLPDEAESIEAAVGVARALFLYEDQLLAMTKTKDNPNGVLRKDKVELALSYVPTGNNDFTSDRQGYYDRTAGDQVNLGLGQGFQSSRFWANRGPIKVWRIHTRAFDMDGDGVPEENIFWWHELSQQMIGWAPYEYLAPERPFFAFCPYPRPARFYGFSLIERLAPISQEISLMYNARNNLIDLILRPPLLERAGDEIKDNQQQWAPGTRWKVTDPTSSLKWFTPPTDSETVSFQQEQMTNRYVDMLTGLSAPAIGAMQSSRRTAQEVRSELAASGTRNDAIALRLRVACRAIMNFVHRLKIQYMQDQAEFIASGEPQVITRQQLMQPYQIDIAGASDPVDVSARRQEALSLFQLLMSVPWIQQDPVKSYNAARMLLETYNRPDGEILLGTQQDAQMRAQQMQQMQQGLQAKQQNLDQIHQQAAQQAAQTGRLPEYASKLKPANLNVVPPGAPQHGKK